MGQPIDFVPRIPENAMELHENLLKLHKNRSHLKSIKINSNNNHVEVDLDRLANLTKDGADFYIPLKKGKAQEAQTLIDRIMRESEAGQAPSKADAQALFDLIDPAGK